MLNNVTLRFTNSPRLDFQAKGVTIFVGPNNSGKSLVLKELEECFTQPSARRLIVENLSFDVPGKDIIHSTIDDFERRYSAKDAPGHVDIGGFSSGQGRQVERLHVQSLRQMTNDLERLADPRAWYINFFGKWGVLRLDGRSRFNLTDDQAGGDLTREPQNILAYIFSNDAIRKKIRKTIRDALGLYYVIDPTNLGQLRIRLSKTEPLNDEQSLSEAARSYHKNATYIKETSDGVQALTGILTAIMSGEYHTILVDEPEAFLHPPLARKLGKSLASLANERNRVLMASTHSPDFLMGCISSTKNARVVRLEYQDGKSRGRIVDSKQLEEMFKRPLMRSANVISALFHDGVIVTESDNDRVFYSEIYYRITKDQDDAPSILFINAQNKQTVKDIIDPLRQFGVPAAAIVDIDVVKDGGSVWTGWLKAAQIPAALHSGVSSQRSVIYDRLQASGKDMKKDGGVNTLSPQDRAAANDFLDNLNSYGLFIVRHGELENWLIEMGIKGKKTEWAVGMLERLGGDPDDNDYIHPGSDDVWSFMMTIIDWVKNSARKGMP
ncbi:MAG: ATP-dependent nuclease [Paracraurococcus sp.]